jgi:4-hydroxybenzoate polyprenyltransferase
MMPAAAQRVLGGPWPYLELMRPANLVTAAADVMAGYAVAGLPTPRALPWLLASGVLLYAGGVVMNDVFDAISDASGRPERAIPSGRARRTTAALWGMTLLIVGVAAAFAVGVAAGAVASLLALAALLYDAVTKHHRWPGAFTMGACRGLNLLLGVSAAPTVLLGAGDIALVPLLYVAAMTLASTGEVSGGDRRTLALSGAMIAVAVMLLALLTHGAQPALLAMAPFALLLVVRVGAPFWTAWRRPAAAQVRAAVKRGVLSIIVLDAAIAAAYAGFLWGLLVLMLAWPAARLSARFAVT